MHLVHLATTAITAHLKVIGSCEHAYPQIAEDRQLSGRTITITSPEYFSNLYVNGTAARILASIETHMQYYSSLLAGDV